ncbi:MAG TPA: Rnase Y domain-containing protein, partial [Niabella sp.]|nr:Rnase Y domain-containing protein [Niabella sp.]
MEPIIITVITAVIALAAGIMAGKFIFAKNTKRQVEEAELHAKNIVKEAELRAENIRKEKELEAKERFVSLKSAHEKEVNERNRKLADSENRIRQKEQSLNQKEANA